MSNSLIQVRIDDELKNDSSNICEELGIDLSTAIRMFLKRMVAENGLPFSTNLDKGTSKNEVLRAVCDSLNTERDVER